MTAVRVEPANESCAESVRFFKAVESHIENDPYMILFSYGDYTCSVSRRTGTHVGPLRGLGWRDSSSDS